MALKTVRRVTFSLPKTTVMKLELRIPKNKRSKFVAEAIEKTLVKPEEVTLEEIHEFWTNLAKKCPRKSKKTAVQLVREDRNSH